MKNNFKKYFGAEKNGVNLLASLENLPLEKMELFLQKISEIPSSAKIFFMGNGGSFDNARLISQLFRQAGLKSKVPGNPDDYFMTTASKGYESIFSEGLKADNFGTNDICIGISGSGNSPNIIKALNYAKKHNSCIFCFGGRDGGKMSTVCGEPYSMIVNNQSMEAIEDLHTIIALEILRASTSKQKLKDVHFDFVEDFKAFMSESNFQVLGKIGTALLETIFNKSRTFILGLGIGANHFRADMGRGATNTIPVRGIATPEVFNINSSQATANDDGHDFILADGLVKFCPNENDFALLCDIENQPEVYNHCKEILDASKTPYFSIGKNGLDISMFEKWSQDFAVSMIGHACGHVIREKLQELFSVREIEIDIKFPEGQKKLGMKQTIELERLLKENKVISENEMVTFCYGKIYAVKNNDKIIFERCYY